MAADKIDQYLQLLGPDGWTFQEGTREGQSRWWFLSCRTARRKIEVFCSFDADCLSFQLPTQIRVAPGCREALWRFLLELNYELRFAKLSCTAEGAIYLAAELPTSALSFASVADLLSSLRIYFEHYHREIELLASDSGLAVAWLSLARQPGTDHEPEVTLLSHN